MYGDVTIVNDGFNSALNKMNISFSSYEIKWIFHSLLMIKNIKMIKYF
jgi:hypothetical protein